MTDFNGMFKETIDQTKIPFKVMAIASAIREAGGRAFLVGGALRDLFLGLEPCDWDVATDLEPQAVLSIFPGASTVGMRFGRLAVGDVDVVSLRAESSYVDMRHPERVEFGVPLEKDLERRDFTVNAMAWDVFSQELIDPFGGKEDLRSRLLRTVGDAEERLREDPLRILRAVRLKNTLGFNLDSSLTKSIPELAESLKAISGERVFSELKRILLCDSVYQGIMDLYFYGIGLQIIPEVFRAYPVDVAQRVSFCRQDLTTRLAAFLSCERSYSNTVAKKPGIDQFWSRFNLSQKLRQEVEWLLYNGDPRCVLAEKTWLLKRSTGDILSEDPAYGVRRIIYYVGQEQLYRLIDLKCALWRASGASGIPDSVCFLIAGLWRVKSDRQEFRKIALDGKDVMDILGLEPGSLVGEALSYLEERVLREPSVNERDKLTRILLKWWNSRN